jgi:hypothetical protein
MRIALLFALILALSFFWRPAVSEEEYVYYGVVPERTYQYQPKHTLHGAVDLTAGWKLNTASLRSTALIGIVGFKDNTQVKLYVLENKAWKLKTEVTLGKMEKSFHVLPNGTIFKVATSNPALVLLLSALPTESPPTLEDFEGPTPVTFYISTDGSYVGKEFMILASQGLSGEPYHIFSLEPAQVTITREDGVKTTFKLEANSHKQLALKAFKVYHIESTGNLMIQSGGPGGMTFFIPSATGGFVGKRFYTRSAGSFGVKEDYGFRICALEDTKVKIWDLAYKKIIQEVQVKGGETVNLKPEAAGPDYVIAVESEKPITFSFVHSGNIKREYGWAYGRGVTSFIVMPNEETPFYLPTNSTVKVYIFASEDAQVMIDDVPVTIKKDSFFTLTTPGIHRIRSDKSLVIEIIQTPLIPPTQGVDGFGFTVLSAELANVKPNVKLSPIAAETGFPTTMIIAGVAAAGAAAAIGVLATRRRKK